MSDTLVAALIGGVFTIVGSVAAVYVQRRFEARLPGRRNPPAPDPAPPRQAGGQAPRPAPPAAAGHNGKAIAAASAGLFGLVAGEPAIGLSCAGLALWLGSRSLAEAGAGGRGLAWAGVALGALGGLGSIADMMMPAPSPLLFAPMLYPY